MRDGLCRLVPIPLVCLLALATSASAEGWTLWIAQAIYGLDGEVYGRPGGSWLAQGSFQTVALCEECLWAVSRQALKDDPYLDSIGDVLPGPVTLYKSTPSHSYSSYFCAPDTFVPWALPKRWVLWAQRLTGPQYKAWYIVASFETKKACDERKVQNLPTRICLPDTVDPRGPKGK